MDKKIADGMIKIVDYHGIDKVMMDSSFQQTKHFEVMIS